MLSLNRRMHCACLALAVALAPPALGDGAERLAEAMAPLHTFTAGFRQETRDGSGVLAEASAGRFRLERPSRFRIDFEGEYPGAIVSDGRTWWVYESELLQVVVRDLASYADQIPVMVLTTQPEQLYAQYEIDWFDSEVDEKTFVLTPKDQRALYATVTIVLSQGKPQLLEVRSQVGDSTRISFDDAEINATLSTDTFVFDIPEGVDVIDERVAEADAQASGE